ncbi:hypothetical protein [Streptosporangium lutulentum]|uniref:Uncharacterized protein n=1 Tax=Streptosporangium lutulentum TaxID=1461250 RepID=A0ABT9QN20_9ACTN|nr:hypothetical protein [Streptosporangium lutulentum]MDP9848144.1 hypothetical protein [Streptosporangium lutulentum]
MTEESAPGLYEALATIAAAARAAYADGSNLRVRSSGIVHAVVMTRWLGGERMPGLACMVGGAVGIRARRIRAGARSPADAA